MQICAQWTGPEEDERRLLATLLPSDPLCILDLGCGDALNSRHIALNHPQHHVTGYEVDRLQHEKNLAADTPTNMLFKLGGAQDIDERDGTTDWVFMFKSLHHVPVASMREALSEITRVLRPGGCAYVSEPIYGGDFNDILRLFHDEERVRAAAFEAMVGAVEEGLLNSLRQVFFRQPYKFEDFADFERRVIGVTHTHHRLSAEIYETVKGRFEDYARRKGVAEFLSPMRIDILQKPV